jgi:hypothetical protein
MYIFESFFFYYTAQTFVLFHHLQLTYPKVSEILFPADTSVQPRFLEILFWPKGEGASGNTVPSVDVNVLDKRPLSIAHIFFSPSLFLPIFAKPVDVIFFSC